MKTKLESKHIVDYYAGSAPIIITVRHDGPATIIGDEILPKLRDKDTNDRGTMLLGLMILEEFALLRRGQPFLIMNKITRNRCTPEMFGMYYEDVLQTAQACLKRWEQCFVFDLHRFYKYPAVGKYDIFLGTNHRRTISGDVDETFARILIDRMWHATGAMLKVYVPGKKIKDGERFGATRERTLVNWLKKEEPRVEAIQIEIYKDFFKNALFIHLLPRALAGAMYQAGLAK
jgi:hypothetical protein